jgi:hypothetical protein
MEEFFIPGDVGSDAFVFVLAGLLTYVPRRQKDIVFDR